jgi:nitrite reductase (NADH) small subunit
MDSFVRVCSKKDFVDNKYLATVGEKPIAVFLIDGKYYAISNVCAHMGGPLIDGSVDKDGNIVCPWHGQSFDPKTGRSPKGEGHRVDAYPVREEGDEIYVAIQSISDQKFNEERIELTPKTPQPQLDDSFSWKCIVCMKEYTGRLPPKTCSRCRAPNELIQPKKEALSSIPSDLAEKPTYTIEEEAVTEYLTKTITKGEFTPQRLEIWQGIAQQPPIDVLVISASAQPQHIVNGYICPKIIERIREKHVDTTYEWIELSQYKIDHNRACYSLADDQCSFPCNNMSDDMRKIYPKMIRAKSLIIVTPINWEGMNSHLKVFLDRLTNLQDVGLKTERVDWAGRPVGIFVNGHEDGAYKVAWDVFVVLQNLGYILPPFAIWYNLSNLNEDTKNDLQKLRDNQLAINRLNKVVDNVVHFMKLRIDKQLNWSPEGEKLRRVHYVAM